MELINKRIKKLRKEKDMTLKELSQKTGLSISFLSQVERGTTSLAITSLKKIADALGVTMNVFFENTDNQSFVVRQKDQKKFQIEGSTTEYVNLSGKFSGRKLESLIVKVKKGKFQDEVFSHPGEEFYYVLEGRGVFNVDGREYVLNEGDSIHFPSDLPHSLENNSDKDLILLCVLTPVIF